MNARQPYPPSRKGWFGVVLFIFLLTACGTQPAPPAAPTSPPTETPTPQPTLTPTPTETPVPTPTPIPTLPPEQVGGLSGIPDPHAAAPELFDLTRPAASIPQFVNAMGMAGIEVDPQEVANNLQYQTLTGADGKPYVIGAFNLDPDPNKKGETLEGPIPLLISEQGKNGEWRWSKISLKKAGKISGLENFGVLLHPDISDLAKIEASEFDLGAITFSWNDHVNQEGKVNFSWPDSQLREAVYNNMNTIFQHILFPGDSPKWLDTMPPEEVKSFMEKVIIKIMTHYKGKIDKFVVVNEPYIVPYRTYDPFYKAFGNSYDYIVFAFSVARKANPDAFLILNDSGNHSSDPNSPNGLTTNLTRKLIHNLKSKGLIDGVGVQMHIDASKPPSEEDIITTLNSYRLPVMITELDVDMSNIKGTPEEKNLIQASIYSTIIRAAKKSGNTISVALWGIGDKYSWLEIDGKTDANPTLFDDNLNPKASYFAVLRELIRK